jgi:hypothetical protein
LPEPKAEELGALWVNTGAKGEYLTGTIGGVRVVCFRNDKKTPGDKLPTWRVLKAKAPDEDRGPRRELTDEEAPF